MTIERFGPMRSIVVLLLAHIASLGCAQDPFVLNDTTFIVRDTVGPYHAVFIAAPGDTAWYGQVAGPMADLSVDKWVMSQRKVLLDMGKKSPEVASTQYFNRRDWVKAVMWRGRAYLYRPSDPINHFRSQEFPRLIVTHDGVEPMPYVAVGYPATITGSMPGVDYPCVSVMSHAMDPLHDTLHVRLYTLDKETRLTLWEFEENGGDAAHQLMVPRENARLLPIIVNYSPKQKEEEMEFDALGPHLLKR